jgi:hypothetical protein
MKKKYNTLNKKLNKLSESQRNNNKHNCNQNNHTFFKRTENLTNVTFSEDEMKFLNKGLKYNLHHKQKRRIRTLAIEADTATNMLPDNDQS